MCIVVVCFYNELNVWVWFVDGLVKLKLDGVYWVFVVFSFSVRNVD